MQTTVYDLIAEKESFAGMDNIHCPICNRLEPAEDIETYGHCIYCESNKD